MGKVLRQSALVAVAVWCLMLVSGCTSDGSEGESSFRNLGKRGDSDVPAGHASAVLR